MNILNNNKIDLSLFKNAIATPEVFRKSTCKFWDDDHVSAQMLKYHLNPDVESASKTRQTIENETAFIIRETKMSAGKSVLDLGCGPGLYVKEFAKTGAQVTGTDFSQRSIDYANVHIKPQCPNAQFVCLNYLEMNFQNAFDIATMIFYDFGALNPNEQKVLLGNVHTALKENGVFIFDVISDKRNVPPATSVTVHDDGFWSPSPYIEIYNRYLYETPKTEGIQYTIIDEDGQTRIIRIYHRLFSVGEISELLSENGFVLETVYGNLSGAAYTDASEIFAVIARKR